MFIIYDCNTTKPLRVMRYGYWQDAIFANESAAKAYLSRKKISRDQYAWAEYTCYINNIRKNETVKNLMSNKDVVQPVDTPRCCDPSSELYWSM